MSYVMNEIWASSTNYGATRPTSNIKYIVIHYTSNNGDTAENNGKYFQGANRKASAHYFVDSDSIVHSVPDNRIAWSEINIIMLVEDFMELQKMQIL